MRCHLIDILKGEYVKNYSFVIKVRSVYTDKIYKRRYTTKSKNLNGAVSKVYQEVPNLIDIVALM